LRFNANQLNVSECCVRCCYRVVIDANLFPLQFTSLHFAHTLLIALLFALECKNDEPFQLKPSGDWLPVMGPEDVFTVTSKAAETAAAARTNVNAARKFIGSTQQRLLSSKVFVQNRAKKQT
jgi:hypothetical protein